MAFKENEPINLLKYSYPHDNSSILKKINFTSSDIFSIYLTATSV